MNCNPRKPVTDIEHAEAEHRIANSLALLAASLRQESRQISSEASAKLALESASARLAATARLHRELSRRGSSDKVDLETFVERLRGDLSEITGVSFTLTIVDIKVPAIVAGQICIIINELAMNAAKHSKCDGAPTAMSVTAVRRADKGLVITVKDNGCGLPRGFAFEKSAGLGMLILTSTIQRLGGTIRMLENTGAAFQISLPAQ